MPLFPQPGWIQIGYHKVIESFTTITVSGLASFPLLLVLLNTTGQSGAQAAGLRFNGDAGNNYNFSGNNTQNYIGSGAGSLTTGRSIWYHIVNYATAVKTVSMIGVQGTTISANATDDSNFGCWNNTSNAISRVDLFIVGGGTWNASSEVYVFGFNAIQG